MRHVVAAIDFSELSAAVVRQAAAVAEAFSAPLLLVHVAAPDPEFVGYESGPETVRDARGRELREEHRGLQAMAEDLRARGLETKALLVQGATVETLLHEAERHDADLLVVGSHGKGALRRALLGSVSEAVIRAAHCAVMVIPAEGRGPDA